MLMLLLLGASDSTRAIYLRQLRAQSADQPTGPAGALYNNKHQQQRDGLDAASHRSHRVASNCRQPRRAVVAAIGASTGVLSQRL